MIIRGGAIGEFILTCPVFAALRAQFPETGLEILGYPRIAQLAKTAGLVDDIRSIETRAAAGFFARQGALDPDLCDYFAQFTVILSYLYDPDGIFQINVGRASAAQFISGPARPSEAENVHATGVFLKPLERLAIFEADPTPRLTFPSSETHSGPWIAVHAGGDFNHPRNWSESKWRVFLETILARTFYRILLIASDGEARAVERLAANLPAERVSLVKNASFSDLAAHFTNCQAFIGHDSGISQLAAATGIPCIALWGSSNEAIWRPLGKNVVVLKNRAGAIGITHEEALAALPMVWAGAE